MEHNSKNQERIVAETTREAWEALAKENNEQALDEDLEK